MSVNKVNSDGSLTKIAGGASEASNITYDNTDSGLIASNVQDAIDEIAEGGGGGGLLPHLIIISEDGESEVKAVKGSTEIIATRTSTGHYECDVPEFGTWTIHAVLNGDDAQVNLVVDTVKVYTVDDSHFHADITVNFPVWEATCNLAGQGESYYATSDPYTFTVHSAGTYTITVVEGSNTYTDTVEVTATGQTFSKVVPLPVDAPLDNINYWLWYGGIDNSEGDYSTLADILADTTALSALMASQNAVDYLVRNTSWATDITASEDAMTYIGLNNYCANTLLAETTTWRTAICNSTYFESVLNVKAPIMTSATTPSGVVSASSQNSNNGWAYHAFDGNDSTTWGTSGNVATGWIQYEWNSPCTIYKYSVLFHNVVQQDSFSISRSSDGTTFTDITETITTSVLLNEGIATKNIGQGTICRLTSNGNVGYGKYADTIQFYGRQDV